MCICAYTHPYAQCKHICIELWQAEIRESLPAEFSELHEDVTQQIRALVETFKVLATVHRAQAYVHVVPTDVCTSQTRIHARCTHAYV